MLNKVVVAQKKGRTPVKKRNRYYFGAGVHFLQPQSKRTIKSFSIHLFSYEEPQSRNQTLHWLKEFRHKQSYYGLLLFGHSLKTRSFVSCQSSTCTDLLMSCCNDNDFTSLKNSFYCCFLNLVN